jgi:hypothetical protein
MLNLDGAGHRCSEHHEVVGELGKVAKTVAPSG